MRGITGSARVSAGRRRVLRLLSKGLSAAGLISLLLLAGATASLASPPLLSREKSSPSIASSYGSGDFGNWIVDSQGLPAYSYETEELTSPFAAQAELSGNVNAWSQIGNDHVVADAVNHGYMQLWSQDRLYQWTNHYDAPPDHYAGGFGYMTRGGKVTRRSTTTVRRARPLASDLRRRLLRKTAEFAGLDVHEHVYAPFGNDAAAPARRHDPQDTSRGQRAAPTSSTGTSTRRSRRHSSRRGTSPVVAPGDRHARGHAACPTAPTRTAEHLLRSVLQAPMPATTPTRGLLRAGIARAARQRSLAGRLDADSSPRAGAANGPGTRCSDAAPDLARRRTRASPCATLYGYAHPRRSRALVASTAVPARRCVSARRGGARGFPRSHSAAAALGSRANCSGTPTQSARMRPTRIALGGTSSRKAVTTSTPSV